VDEREMVIRPAPTPVPYWWIGYPLVILLWLGCVYLLIHPAAVPGFFEAPRVAFGLYALVAFLPLAGASGLVSTQTSSVYLTPTHLGRTRFARAPVVCLRTDLARVLVFSEHHPAPSIYKPDG
jgi:hypothetical protein